MTLETRKGLPDALRILLAEYPRDIWEGHTNFDGLTRFWLSRHLEFRKALDMMQNDAKQAIDNLEDQRLLTHRITRVGGFLIEALHGHHFMEDTQYFPLFIETEPRLSVGFELLDTDHHTLNEHLDTLDSRVGSLARTLERTDDPKKVMGDMLKQLGEFETFLNRHLIDEEELIVPIILKYGPPQA